MTYISYCHKTSTCRRYSEPLEKERRTSDFWPLEKGRKQWDLEYAKMELLHIPKLSVLYVTYAAIDPNRVVVLFCNTGITVKAMIGSHWLSCLQNKDIDKKHFKHAHVVLNYTYIFLNVLFWSKYHIFFY